MAIEQQLIQSVVSAMIQLSQADINDDQIQLQKTKKEFQGHLTLVVFPFLRLSKKSPEQTAQEIGEYLQQNEPAVSGFNVIKGFLNLTISGKYWVGQLNKIHSEPNFGIRQATEQSQLVLIEYSSPNTNKPLHLGHIRNNLLGFSLAEIMKANGYKVVKTNIVNDRGIHICKSMLAWQKWGEGITPASSGKKGDHLVGDFYVLFDKHYKEELAVLESKGLKEEQSVLMAEVREMLRRWEAGDKEVVELWKTMNGWVYEGFEQTYQKLGVDFDRIYYESETYIEGKETVLDGLQKGVFTSATTTLSGQI
jgi:arginyl-tRNA synthetase